MPQVKRARTRSIVLFAMLLLPSFAQADPAGSKTWDSIPTRSDQTTSASPPPSARIAPSPNKGPVSLALLIGQSGDPKDNACNFTSQVRSAFAGALQKIKPTDRIIVAVFDEQSRSSPPGKPDPKLILVEGMSPMTQPAHPEEALRGLDTRTHASIFDALESVKEYLRRKDVVPAIGVVTRHSEVMNDKRVSEEMKTILEGRGIQSISFSPCVAGRNDSHQSLENFIVSCTTGDLLTGIFDLPPSAGVGLHPLPEGSSIDRTKPVLIIVADKSGSMKEGNRDKQLVSAVTAAIDKLPAGSTFGFIAFDVGPFIMIPASALNAKSRPVMKKRLKLLSGYAKSNLFPALHVADQFANTQPFPKKSVVIISDGKLELGKNEEDLITKLASHGVAVSTLLPKDAPQETIDTFRRYSAKAKGQTILFDGEEDLERGLLGIAGAVPN